MIIADDSPGAVVPEANLVPLSDHLPRMAEIPPSRMFLINKSLAVYRQRHPDAVTFDASHGAGGREGLRPAASLPAGEAEEGGACGDAALEACVQHAARLGRKIAGLVVT